MKRRNKLLILLGVLAVICIATVIVMNLEVRKEKIRTTEAVILQIPADTVETLSWEYDETALSYHKDGTWYWDDDAAFPVDEDKIGDLLENFEELAAAFVIEDVDDYSQYGLDDPTCTIRLTADGTSYEVKLGAYSTMDAQRYLSIGDGNVYLVKNDPFDDFEIELGDTILQDTTPEFETISKITFSGAENYTLTYEEDSDATYCDEDVYFTELDGKKVPADTELVKKYCNSITNMSLADYVSYNVTDEELAAWGLDAPELTVSIDYTEKAEDGSEESGTFVLHVGRNAEELAAKQEAEASGEEYSGTVTVYVRVGDSQKIYRVTDAVYTAMTAASYDDLRHTEILSCGFDKATRIDVTLDGTDYVIETGASSGDDESSESGESSAAESEEETTVYLYNGEEIDVTSLRSAVNAMVITHFNNAQPEDKEELRMVFHLDDENHPEVEVVMYRQNGTYCLAVVDGETVGYIERSFVVDVIEAINRIVLD